MREPNATQLPSRAAVERAIEALIGLLDEVDAPAEGLEPNDGGEDDAYLYALNVDDDCEPGTDEEPDLGWTESEARFGEYGWAAEFAPDHAA